tara:strand:- start:1961 stop:3157 length:1197 start_codon:yes stop_codon:yes gene_type:complete
MIGFPQKTLQELELEKMYPVQANAGIGFPQGTPQSIGMNTMYPVQNKAVVPAVNSNQGQMQAQPQPRTGMAGLFDKFNQRSDTTGLSGFENFAASLDALILPDLRSGDAIRKRGEQRVAGGNKNKTVQMLIKAGRQDLADMVLAGTITPAQAANVLLTAPKDTRTSQIKNYEYFKSLGLSHEEALAQVQSGTNVNLNTGGDNDTFAKVDAKTLGAVADSGLKALGNLGKIDRLEGLLQNADTGAVGFFKNLAGNFGVETDGLGDIQAAVALINSLVPEQRQAGSGPMSDADLELFKQSLPRLINTKAGNALIIQTMRGIAKYDAMATEIIQKHRRDPAGFTIAMVYDELYARPSPFENFNQQVGIASGQVVPPMPEGFTLGQEVWRTMTPAERSPFMQ